MRVRRSVEGTIAVLLSVHLAIAEPACTCRDKVVDAAAADLARSYRLAD